MENEFEKNVKKVIQNYMKSGAFTDRKLTDTPTDNLQVVNRRYVNLNGTFTNRPNSSVATLGQQYFATDLNYPVFRGNSSWFSATGSIVGF